VRQREMPALVEIKLPVQVLCQAFIEPQRCVVESDAGISAVVRSQDGRIAGAVSATDIAFLEQRYFLMPWIFPR
jgi:hypothetical protein